MLRLLIPLLFLNVSLHASMEEAPKPTIASAWKTYLEPIPVEAYPDILPFFESFRRVTDQESLRTAFVNLKGKIHPFSIADMSRVYRDTDSRAEKRRFPKALLAFSTLPTENLYDKKGVFLLDSSFFLMYGFLENDVSKIPFFKKVALALLDIKEETKQKEKTFLGAVDKDSR